MRLAIFDLDKTLLQGDSDHAWGEFLCNKGVVDPVEYREANDRFFEHYQQGTLDIHEFLGFALHPLTRFPLADLQRWHSEFMHSCIEPMISQKSLALLEQHRTAGDYLLIITATNAFITRPIAERLGVDHLLATEPEMRDGVYTGEISGTPCFQAGKVERLHEWLQETGYSLTGSYFYSDSCNDLPLLEVVDNPVAVNPDARLSDIARTRMWPIISLCD